MYNFSKITFHNTKNVVLSGNYDILYTIMPQGVLFIDTPKEQLVGLSNMQHQIDTIKLKFLMTDVSFLYDQSFIPIQMDSNKILSKYMIFVHYYRHVQPYFILMDQLEVDFPNGIVNLLAVPISGVVSRYKNVYTISQDNQVIPVPRKIAHTQQTRDKLASIVGNPYASMLNKHQDLRTYVPSIQSVWSTIIVNIFSNNGQDTRASYFFDHPDVIDYWYAYLPTLAYNTRKFARIVNNSQTMVYDQIVSTIELFDEQIAPDLSNWIDSVYNYIEVNKNIQSPSLIAEGYNVFNNDWLNSDGNIVGKYSMGYRAGLTFTQKQNGLKFNQLIYRLYQSGYFPNGYHVIRQGDGVPYPLPEPNTHIVGYTQQKPLWVATGNYPYSWRNIANQLKKVALAIQFSVFGTSWRRTQRRFKFRDRSIRFFLDYNNPTRIVSTQDTGWRQGIINNLIYQLYLQNYIYSDQFGNYRYRYRRPNSVSDNYCHLFDMKLYQIPDKITLRGYQVSVYNRFMSKMSLNTILLDFDPIFSQQAAKQVDLIQLFKQLNRLNFCIVLSTRPFTPQNIPTQRINRYIRPILSDDVDFIQISQDQVLTYRNIPFLQKYDSPYSIFQPNPIIEGSWKLIYTQICNSYRRKISLTIIGNYDYHFTTDRYFKFKQKIYMLTAVHHNNDGTVSIEGITT